jgi:hypothetical protein
VVRVVSVSFSAADTVAVAVSFSTVVPLPVELAFVDSPSTAD